MSKIISNYKIVKEAEVVDDDSQYKSIDPIIKIPIISKEEKEIVHEAPTPVAIEPKLQLMRNNEGIIVGIEVQCRCGEKLLIRLDYTL